MESRYGNIEGRRFGRLVVIKDLGTDKSRGYKRFLRCVCDCGNVVIVMANNLMRKHTQSCGCLFKEVQSEIHGIHHATKTRLYRIWTNMKGRCNNPNVPKYSVYGARGIRVCPEWETFEPFMEWALRNGYSDELSIDRIDGSKGYFPGNCRWGDSFLQANNQSKNIVIPFGGKTKTLAEWCRVLDIPYHRTYARLFKLGWSLSRAFGKELKIS
jgi:ribosomal protein S27E